MPDSSEGFRGRYGGIQRNDSYSSNTAHPRARRLDYDETSTLRQNQGDRLTSSGGRVTPRRTRRQREASEHSLSSEASIPPPATRFQPSRKVDWHGPLCQFLKISEDSSIEEISEALEDAAAKLELAEEIGDLMSGDDHGSEDGLPTWQVIHRIECHDLRDDTALYLEEPYLVARGVDNAHLVGSKAIVGGLELHLEKNKGVSFIVYKDYECCGRRVPPPPRHEKRPPPVPADFLVEKSITIISYYLSEALEAVSKAAIGDLPTPSFEVDESFPEPFLWWFHRRNEIEAAQNELESSQKQHLLTLYRYIMESLGPEWLEVDALLAEGKITARYIHYAFVPNQLVMVKNPTNLPQSEVFVITSWLRALSGGDLFTRSPSTGKRSYNTNGSLDAKYWTFDGNFQRSTTLLHINSLPSLENPFKLQDMSPVPLTHVAQEQQNTIRERGKMFWKCRKQNYVCYTDRVTGTVQNLSESRFMIDYATYKLMHASDSSKPPEPSSAGDLEPGMMEQDEAPYGDDFVMCLPTKVFGYNMHKKDWSMIFPCFETLLTIRKVTLDVSRIRPVIWNIQAFDTLVIDDETKELVSALVTNQIDVDRNTDLMSGKGNGLFILLHGGPGTGKTLTAESVAEFAKRPLYRVTCGDIGTKAEDVEKYLEYVLHLGKTWGCVVLLDEADVFLEQRTLFDLQRNALVSVFLRVLEYYNGILILTSNRVGTFDEAFKSRIQLSLRYKNLDFKQRLQIWTNFITRLEGFQTIPQDEKQPTVSISEDLGDIDGSSADRVIRVQAASPDSKSGVNGGVDLGINVEEIKGKLPELAKVELNGREIRNVVSTARQLAMFRKVQMGYEHLETVIGEAEKFDKYLLDLAKGWTADQQKNRKGER